MQQKAVIMDSNAIKRAVTRLTYEILERNRGASELCIVGILTKGVNLAKRIADKIYEVEGVKVEVGHIDISKFRDDRNNESVNDLSKLDFDIVNKKVVLVDDVIYTGRSTRAAIDGIMKRGRPKCVQLAVLIDRGHRELPIRADYVGKNVPTSSEEIVKVLVDEPDTDDKVVILK